jgi:hypothetical protein
MKTGQLVSAGVSNALCHVQEVLPLEIGGHQTGVPITFLS